MKKRFVSFLLVFVLGLSLVEARTGGGGPPLNITEPALEMSPWLTGPLLAPSGHNVPTGHVNIEPYLFWTQYRGFYDNNWKFKGSHHYTSVTLNVPFQFGILPATEFDVVPQVFYNYSQGQTSWQFGDLGLVLSFQLLNDQQGKSWPPAIKLRFAASAPTGKYDHLKPSKQGTDVGGGGSWSPNVGIVFSNLFHFSGPHFLAMRSFFNYGPTVATSVHGLNVYGGTKGTHGTAYPGNNFSANFGFEYSLSQPWTLALDILYTYQAKNRFSGYDAGVPMTSPSSASYSLAPAIEYNFTDNIGLIGGSWFTVAGRNTAQYINWILALNIYI
jgi:hypothetical protein